MAAQSQTVPPVHPRDDPALAPEWAGLIHDCVALAVSAYVNGWRPASADTAGDAAPASDPQHSA